MCAKNIVKMLLIIAPVWFFSGLADAQVSVRDYERAAIERVKRDRAAAQQAEAQRRAEAAKADAQMKAEAAQVAKQIRDEAAQAEAQRRAEARRLEEARRKAANREAARKAAMEAELAARRTALREAEQRTAELRRINQLNAQNRRAELEQKARSGDAQAALDLARIHEIGDFVPTSATAAAIWYKVAAELGNSDAQMKYVKYASSDDNARRDPLVLKYLMELSANNYPEALFLLSKRYADGTGVPLDKQKSLALLKLAADSGLLEAQEEIGKVLQDGSFGKKDFTSSIRYLQSAIAQGSISANYNMGIAYEYGYGVPKDKDLAYRSYLKVYRSGGNEGVRERLKSVDSFSYSGKDYNIAPGNILEMTCPSVDAHIKFENGVIKETLRGNYYEWGSVRKERGRNLYRYTLLLPNMVDFDQKKYVLFTGKTINCE